MLRPPRSALAASLLWLACFQQPSAQQDAAERWYLVEVAVFEHRGSTIRGGLLKEKPPKFPRAENTVELLSAEDIRLMRSSSAEPTPSAGSAKTAAPRPSKFTAYQKVDSRYLAAYRRLRTSREHRVLLHQGWLLDAASGGRAVRLGVYRNGPYPAAGGAASAGMARLRTSMVDAQLLRALDPEVHGFISTQIGARLRVDVNFTWFPYGQRGTRPPGDAPNQAPNAQQNMYAQIREARHIKLNEAHYFDHPLFGVLLQVREVEPS